MNAPQVGSEWVIRYRVLGPSAVWDDFYVCEILTGPDAGDKMVLTAAEFGTDKREQRGVKAALAPPEAKETE